MSQQQDRADFLLAFCYQASSHPVTPKQTARATVIDMRAASGGDHDGHTAALRILADANTVQRLAVEACNRELSKREEKQTAHAEARIRRRALYAGAEVDLNGDPRGAVVKLRFPTGFPANSFGGGGWYCVPTRNY